MNGDSSTILWRLALSSSPQCVYQLLTTEQGRSRFWARSAPQSQGRIHFTFPNGERLESEILDSQPGRRFVITYFGGSKVEFLLESDGDGGCVLTLRETGLSESDARLNAPGWVSVLLNLKACADHNLDLRNHHSDRTWDQGFVDN
ncbi:MAG TPA: SRPBCC domain-containing protein [Acidobacteriota bacterium]|nr:SRPBCC domain-containing protein [Acidobacteriota bacterium]